MTEVTRKRIYRYPDLLELGIDFTNKHLRTMESRGTFPRRVQLSEHSIGWVGDEVDDWIEARIAARRVVPLNLAQASVVPSEVTRRGPGRPRKALPLIDEPRRGPGRPRKVTPAELAPPPAE